MRILAGKNLFPHRIASLAAIAMLAGCSTPQKMSDARLESLGVRAGANHWSATSALYQEGYICSVNGAKRENFDCSKTTGLFPTCILHIDFTVDDQNKIVAVGARDPACLGTP